MQGKELPQGFTPRSAPTGAGPKSSGVVLGEAETIGRKSRKQGREEVRLVTGFEGLGNPLARLRRPPYRCFRMAPDRQAHQSASKRYGRRDAEQGKEQQPWPGCNAASWPP